MDKGHGSQREGGEGVKPPTESSSGSSRQPIRVMVGRPGENVSRVNEPSLNGKRCRKENHAP